MPRGSIEAMGERAPQCGVTARNRRGEDVCGGVSGATAAAFAAPPPPQTKTAGPRKEGRPLGLTSFLIPSPPSLPPSLCVYWRNCESVCSVRNARETKTSVIQRRLPRNVSAPKCAKPTAETGARCRIRAQRRAAEGVNDNS